MLTDLKEQVEDTSQKDISQCYYSCVTGTLIAIAVPVAIYGVAHFYYGPQKQEQLNKLLHKYFGIGATVVDSTTKVDSSTDAVTTATGVVTDVVDSAIKITGEVTDNITD